MAEAVMVSTPFVAIAQALPGTAEAVTEERWSRLVHLLDLTGRFFFDLPMPRADDVVNAIGLADLIHDAQLELVAAREQGEAATAAAVAVMAELEELGPTTPAQDELWNAIAELQGRREPDPIAAVTPPLPEPPVEPAPEPAPQRSHRGGKAVTRYDREAMFAAIRRSSTLAAAARELAITNTAMYARLDTLAGRGELPADIAERRPIVRGEIVSVSAARAPGATSAAIDDRRDDEARRVHEVAEEIKAREASRPTRVETFEARRLAAVAAKVERDRHAAGVDGAA